MFAIGEKSFRAKQIYQWLHQKLITSFDDMTNLSKAIRNKCKEEYHLTVLEAVERKVSVIDGTQKYLFRLED